MRTRGASTATADEVEILVAGESGYLPDGRGGSQFVPEGERRRADDPLVVASRGGWHRDGQRGEWLQARAEHAEELAIANTPPPPKPPTGWNEYVQATEAIQTWEPHPLTHQPVRREIAPGDVLTKADSAYALFPRLFRDVDAPE